VTDEFGDFWFYDLPTGKYKVVIEAKGFEFKVFDAVDATAVDNYGVNLGDIAMDAAE